MDYYEELGLSRSAATEEIRQAYKSLARLLHPDQHQDENLRRLAECQMKRLNAIADILTDYTRRKQYDLGFKPPPRRPPLPASFSTWAWVVTALIGCGSVAWYLKEDGAKASPQALIAARAAAPAEKRPSPPASFPARLSAEREQELAGRLVEVEAQLRTVEHERDLLLRQPPNPQPLNSIEAPPALSFAQNQPGEVEVSPPPTESPPKSFGGTWFYAQRRGAPPSKAFYPPEYIEALIVEEGGTLRGRYRARYKVTDRPISPEVSFQFEGHAGPDAATLRWAGDGGARGEVELKLLSPNTMRVNWSATSLGTRLGLSSGTAVLIRRAESH